MCLAIIVPPCSSRLTTARLLLGVDAHMADPAVLMQDKPTSARPGVFEAEGVMTAATSPTPAELPTLEYSRQWLPRFTPFAAGAVAARAAHPWPTQPRQRPPIARRPIQGSRLRGPCLSPKAQG